VIVPFVFIDMSFFAANLLKLFEGAWVPLLFGVAVAVMIWTWRRGAAILVAKTRRIEVPLMDLIKSLEKRPPHIVKGTAVFLTSDPSLVPTAMMHNLKHNKVLHERVILLTVRIEDVPYIPDEKRLDRREFGSGFYQIVLRYGFMEEIDIPRDLAHTNTCGEPVKMISTSFFLGRQKLIPSKSRPGMALWRERLFSWMVKNSETAMEFFKLPINRVVELGSQVDI
jgi:KUP system potassium uptake protein